MTNHKFKGRDTKTLINLTTYVSSRLLYLLMFF